MPPFSALSHKLRRFNQSLFSTKITLLRQDPPKPLSHIHIPRPPIVVQDLLECPFAYCDVEVEHTHKWNPEFPPVQPVGTCELKIARLFKGQDPFSWLNCWYITSQPGPEPIEPHDFYFVEDYGMVQMQHSATWCDDWEEFTAFNHDGNEPRAILRIMIPAQWANCKCPFFIDPPPPFALPAPPSSLGKSSKRKARHMRWWFHSPEERPSSPVAGRSGGGAPVHN